MKSILLRTTYAGPKGVFHPGIHRFDDAEADALVKAGYASPTVIETEPLVEVATAPPVEIADKPIIPAKKSTRRKKGT